MVTGHNVADIVVILKTLPTGRSSSSVVTQFMATVSSVILYLILCFFIAFDSGSSPGFG